MARQVAKRREHHIEKVGEACVLVAGIGEVGGPCRVGLDGGGLAWVDVTVTDPSGRAWRVLAPDRDGAGGQDSLQLPDVSAAPDPGLAVGDWAAVVESRVFLSTSGATLDDLVLTERFRQEVTYARSASVTLTVN